MPRNKNKQANKGKKNIAIVSGKGAYGIGTAKKMVKGIAKQAVRAAANPNIQRMLTNAAGGLAERVLPGSGQSARSVAQLLLNKITGSGSYTAAGSPSVNSLFKMNKTGQMTGGNALTIPKFATRDDGVILAHREYVGDYIAPTNGELFSYNKYVFNPGDPTILPWLSELAQHFESYEILGLVLELESVTSPYNPTPSMGFMAIAAQYNVLQSDYTSMIELENSNDSIMCRPDDSIMYGVECKSPALRTYFVKNPSNIIVDPATYNFVNLFVASQGLPSSFTPGSVIGQVWMSYHIRLIQPIYKLPYGGSLTMVGNAELALESFNRDYLSPFNTSLADENLPVAINHTGRFTPYSLDGTGTPILSFGSVSGTICPLYSPFQILSEALEFGALTNITFAPYNLAPGMGCLVTITTSFKISDAAYLNAIATGTAAPQVNAATPSLIILDSNSIELKNYTTDGDQDLPASVTVGMYNTNTITASGSNIRMCSGSGSFVNSFVTTFYFVVTGNQPRVTFQYAPAQGVQDYTIPPALDNLPYTLGGISNPGPIAITTTLNAVSIKFVDEVGMPIYSDYVVPATPPLMTSVRNSLSIRSPVDIFAKNSARKSRLALEDTQCLHELMRAHRVTKPINTSHMPKTKRIVSTPVSDVVQTATSEMVDAVAKESSDDGFDIVAPTVSKLMRERSLSFSSRF